MFPTKDALDISKNVWQRGLEQAGLTESQIKFGLGKAVQSKGWIDLGEFIDLCFKNMEDYGLPDAHSAYIEAANAKYPASTSKYTHNAIYHAGVATGFMKLRGELESKVFPKFKKEYERLCKLVMSGEVLNSPKVQLLPENIPKPTSLEQAKEHIKKLKKLLEM